MTNRIPFRNVVALVLALLNVGAAGPLLNIDRAGSNVVIRFSGTLESAVRAEGPYQRVVGATSPYQGSLTNSQQFWRALLPGVRTFAAGGSHTVAVRTDGTLWAWGDNQYGQLGNGTFTNSSTPQQIGTNATWQAVTGGRAHTLALRTDGTLWAWGYNLDGRLGNGTFTSTNTPQPVGTNAVWHAIAAGGSHTVALRADGSLWTWGGNTVGQLGNGSYVLRTNVPQPIATNATWRAVTAGGGHVLALRTDGTLWAWGDGYSGQLGNGASSPPEPQQIGSDATWYSIAAGGSHSLGFRADGTLWGWGNNAWGQFGYGIFGPIGNIGSPQRMLTNATWRAVAGGGAYTMALRADGTLWGCGHNEYGQLGIGRLSTLERSPHQIGTNTTWQAVAAGDYHTLALHADGTLWAWGDHRLGQLGNHTFSPGASTPQPIATNDAWRAVAAGAGGRYTAALRADGTLWAWGDNSYGQLGNGTFVANAENPQRVGTNTNWQAVAAGGRHTVALRVDGTLWEWGNSLNTSSTPQPFGTNEVWHAVSAGDSHTAALRADGTLWAWGSNGWGQLGDGTFTNTSTPQPVGTNTTWRAVAAGTLHTVALRADGTLWVWGRHFYEWTNGRFTVRTNTPQPVGTNAAWQAIAAGDTNTVALRCDGTLWGWGLNVDGQLGNSIWQTNTPQPIATNETWQTVAAGARHTVALRSDGTLWGWGNNAYGQLGDGTFTNTSTARQIGTNATWQAAAAGERHTVALRADGTLWAWGDNSFGQIAQPVPWLPYPVVGGVLWARVPFQ